MENYILPYEEVFTYETNLFMVDVSSYEKNIKKWLSDRKEAEEDDRDATIKLHIGPEGFNLSLYDLHKDNCLLSFSINHVVALQIKQACEYNIDCYKQHALKSDVTIYKSKVVN
jgi:hypothetical protein